MQQAATMANLRLVVLCCLAVVVSSQGPTSNNFCLKMLKSVRREDTKTYLLACISETRTARGRNFNIRDSETTSDIGKCIAQKLGILENNIVNKAKLTVLINAARGNGKLNQAQYQKYSTLVRDCNDWEGCLKRHCHL